MRLLNQVDEKRNPRTTATVHQLIDRWCEVIDASTKQGCVCKIGKHIATLGSIAAAGYQARMAEALPPDLTPEAAGAATGTLGGAAAVAEQLPDEVSGPLLEAALEAFTHGIAATAVVGTPLLAVMAVVVALVLRPARSS